MEVEDGRFKVATFNLYNLVLPGRTFYGNRRYAPDEYQKKRAWIAQQLVHMNADIVGFQEIFDAAALREILAFSGMYDGATLLVGSETGESPAVGLASRFPVLDHGSITHFPETAQLDINGLAVPCDRFSRPVVWALVEIRPEIPVLVLVVHLKSKNPLLDEGMDRHDPVQRAIGKARSLIVRATEATAVRCLLLEKLEGNDNPVIIMGDINDEGTAVTSEIVGGSAPWRKLKFSQKLRIWDTLLYNVKDIQARQSYRDTYYTHIHNGHYECLDHILVSQEFVHQNPSHLGQVEYVSVLNDHLVDDTLSDEVVPMWQSDHGQVVATIRLR